ncbi:MAG: helix-turn-helix domain-containing protein [Oscillospiraceae bacterium]|nr:helix-turn-helix domain-containing protein [Oscillospiraceae bacterium]
MNTIAIYRKRAGLNQAELAEKLNVAQTTVSGWERGYREPDNKALKIMSEVLSVSIDTLLYGVPDEDARIDDLLGKQNFHSMTSFDDYPEVLKIAHIADKMNADQRRRMLIIIENAFPHATHQALHPD